MCVGSSRSSKKAPILVLPHWPDPVAEHQPTDLGFDGRPTVSHLVRTPRGNVGFMTIRFECQKYRLSESIRNRFSPSWRESIA